jgi:hypothetical protein
MPQNEQATAEQMLCNGFRDGFCTHFGNAGKPLLGFHEGSGTYQSAPQQLWRLPV